MPHDLVWVPSTNEPGVAYAIVGDRVYRMQIRYWFAKADQVLASQSINPDPSLWTEVNNVADSDDLATQPDNEVPSPTTVRSS